MSWEKTAYTDAGAALLAASVNGSALAITQAVAATGTTEDDLTTITALNGDVHDLSLLGVETVVTSDNKPARKVTIRIKAPDRRLRQAGRGRRGHAPVCDAGRARDRDPGCRQGV